MEDEREPHIGGPGDLPIDMCPLTSATSCLSFATRKQELQPLHTSDPETLARASTRRPPRVRLLNSNCFLGDGPLDTAAPRRL